MPFSPLIYYKNCSFEKSPTKFSQMRNLYMLLDFTALVNSLVFDYFLIQSFHSETKKLIILGSRNSMVKKKSPKKTMSPWEFSSPPPQFSLPSPLEAVGPPPVCIHSPTRSPFLIYRDAPLIQNTNGPGSSAVWPDLIPSPQTSRGRMSFC